MNSRLTVAAHILGMLAYREREQHCAATSEELAESIGTNPVVVRRALSQLKKAGFVDSRRGVGGGTVLARDPRSITLRQVYQAVQPADTEIIGRHPGALGPNCQVAPVIAAYLDELYGDAEQALLNRLEKVTVDEMSREIVDRLRRRASLHEGGEG